MRRRYKYGIVIFVILLGVSTAIIWFGPWWLSWHFNRFVYSPHAVPAERVAIVFGARIYPDGRLSTMLQDRVETAVQLYQAGKVQKLLLSGFPEQKLPMQLSRKSRCTCRGYPA